MSAVCAAPAAAGVTRLEIRERLPYAGGRAFGAVGAYERILGKAYFSVDPNAAANSTIVDLELAPRNAQGAVEFSADVEILAPVDPSKANGTLLYDVNNRGGRVCLGMFNGGADEFLMRQGYVVAWSGWIGELQAGGERLRLFAPTAKVNGRPIRAKVRAEMAPDVASNRLNVAQWGNHGSYPPTARGLKEATLTYRLREKDPRIPLPRSQWRIEVKPVATSVDEPTLPLVELVLDSGFRPGHLYELVYEAEGPLVQGLGLAGIRDLVSFLKYDRSTRNPLRIGEAATAAEHAIGFGVSQSGRALRMLAYDGLNADEQGRKVFDGLFPHVAGGGLGFFNHRFASPTRHNAQHDNHLYPADVFPFAYGDEQDPFTRKTDGILRRARQAGVTPKVFHTQTSAEYWHRSASLVHTDPLGRRDSVLPSEVRIYAFGGAQHGAGTGVPGAAGFGQQAANPTDYRPLLRGLLTALKDWVRDGVAPPP
ncbi:MAG: alpha/beta hydrolase domain-containing protein, partial [Actinomycetota bacterium]